MVKKENNLSKIWYDHEILFKDSETGEIHLKPGVHRQNYGDHLNQEELEDHFNMIEYRVRKTNEILEMLDMLEINNNEE